MTKGSMPNHSEAVNFVKDKLSEYFPELRLSKEARNVELPKSIDIVELINGNVSTAISVVDDAVRFNTNGKLRQDGYDKITSHYYSLSRFKSKLKILVLTDFQVYCQYRDRFHKDEGKKLPSRIMDNPSVSFSVPQDKILVVLMDFPLFTNIGDWAKSKYSELTLSNIIAGLQFGKIQLEDIPELVEVNGKLTNQRELAKRLLLRRGFRPKKNKQKVAQR